MLAKYNSEIEGMIDFWKELNIEPDYELNTDGRFQGNLIEFKLVLNDMKKHKQQIARYIEAYNSCALPIPKYSYLISINEHKYFKINNETKDEICSGTWNSPKDFLEEFTRQDEYIKGWINEYSIVAYNNKLCNDFKKIIKSKEDVKKELISPQFLNIIPFAWDKQIEEENKEKDKIGWLHFNMNMLGPLLLKKQLGAFFTPERYVKIATDMVRDAIKKIPEGNDYIILDRCAGTGNLERFLFPDELSHCVLNTYDYTEWTTLKGLYEGRVRMIIPPTRQCMDLNKGLLTDGDALSEEFNNFCFNSGQCGFYDNTYEKQSKQLAKWFNDDKTSIILLENPPFVEPQGGASQGKPTFKIKDKFLYKEMAKEKFETKNTNRASENLFIWSGFKFFLKQPTDSYILFSPIKYWKSQHIVDKTFVRGYICNRANFNASEGGILLIHWLNSNDKNEILQVDSDLGARKIKKMHSNPSVLLKDSKSQNAIAYLFNLSNIPKADNGKLINDINSYKEYCKVQKAYKLSNDNILLQLPLWVANCYEYSDYTEREIIMKTGDKSFEYGNDNEFLYKCLLWSGISQINKCLSKVDLLNQFCFNQNTMADNLLKCYKMDKNDEKLYSLWVSVLDFAKTTEEFVNGWNYGLYQIDKEINIKIPSGSFNKKNEEILVPKYPKLDEMISSLKDLLKKYYIEELKVKLFKYELLK